MPSLISLAALGTCAWLASFQEPAPEPAEGAARGVYMAAYTKAFLSQLSDGARQLAMTSFDVPERRTWAFGPVRREGVNLAQLEPKEFALLESLLDTVLSKEGMEAWRQVRELENVLRKLESTPERVATHRDPDLYWLRVYGDPDPKNAWSWRFEGHHLALHVTCQPGRVPTVTPFFLGASPLIGSGTDKARVAAFQDLNRGLHGLLNALDETAATKVQPGLAGSGPRDVIIPRPGDVRMGPGQAKLPAPSGASLAELTPEAAAQLEALLATYLGLLDPELRTYRLSTIDPSAVHFARWGSVELDGARTWSILTDTFALELATTDGPAHVHALLRDVRRDFGGE